MSLSIAYVTLLVNDDFAVGVETLAKSLARVHARYPLWVMCCPHRVTDQCRQRMRQLPLINRVVMIDRVPRPRSFSTVYNSQWDVAALTKLRVWQLPLDVAIYIDADCIVLENVDDLAIRASRVEFAAAPDVFPPDKFNAGVMVIRPSLDEFKRLIRAIPAVASYDGGDTGFLNKLFPDWYLGSASGRLPFRYNAQWTVQLLTRQQPGYWLDAVGKPAILHFCSRPKPWEMQEAGENSVVGLQGRIEMKNLWWNIFRCKESIHNVEQLPEVHLHKVDLNSRSLEKSKSTRSLPRSFDDGMEGVYINSSDPYNAQVMERWRTEYDTRVLVTPSNIPRIVHQIWLGSCPVPERMRAWRETWMQIDWEYKLWTDSDWSEFQFSNPNLAQRSNNSVERADIFRWEILSRHGGVYVDVDFERIGPIDPLLSIGNFIVGVANTGYVEVNTAFIAASPKHPFVNQMIMEEISLPSLDADRNFATQLIDKVGAGCLTRAIFRLSSEMMHTHRMVVLPCNVLYPLPNSMRTLRNTEDKKLFEYDCSLAVHHWSCTWQTIATDQIDEPNHIKTIVCELSRAIARDKYCDRDGSLSTMIQSYIG